jgi:hypothetical protein
MGFAALNPSYIAALLKTLAHGWFAAKHGESLDPSPRRMTGRGQGEGQAFQHANTLVRGVAEHFPLTPALSPQAGRGGGASQAGECFDR